MKSEIVQASQEHAQADLQFLEAAGVPLGVDAAGNKRLRGVANPIAILLQSCQGLFIVAGLDQVADRVHFAGTKLGQDFGFVDRLGFFDVLGAHLGKGILRGGGTGQRQDYGHNDQNPDNTEVRCAARHGHLCLPTAIADSEYFIATTSGKTPGSACCGDGRRGLAGLAGRPARSARRDGRAPRSAALRRSLAGGMGAIALRQDARQVLAGERVRVARDLFGRAGGDDLATAHAAVGAEVDHPVGGLDDFEIVLDDENRGAFLEQLAERQ